MDKEQTGIVSSFQVNELEAEARAISGAIGSLYIWDLSRRWFVTPHSQPKLAEIDVRDLQLDLFRHVVRASGLFRILFDVYPEWNAQLDTNAVGLICFGDEFSFETAKYIHFKQLCNKILHAKDADVKIVRGSVEWGFFRQRVPGEEVGYVDPFHAAFRMNGTQFERKKAVKWTCVFDALLFCDVFLEYMAWLKVVPDTEQNSSRGLESQ